MATIMISAIRDHFSRHYAGGTVPSVSAATGRSIRELPWCTTTTTPRRSLDDDAVGNPHSGNGD